jgi:hypothetical protein
MESKPVEQVKSAIRFLMLHPDTRPSGISPISKERGQTLNEFAKPLLATIQALDAVRPKDERWLAVSHGGNLQQINQWLVDGKKSDLSFDFREMAKAPYWSAVGKTFMVGDKKLEEVKDNEKPGLYLIEHNATAYNRGNDKGMKPK